MWLATSTLNRFWLLLIYGNIVWLSVQNLSLTPSICNSFRSRHTTFTDKLLLSIPVWRLIQISLEAFSISLLTNWIVSSHRYWQTLLYNCIDCIHVQMRQTNDEWLFLPVRGALRKRCSEKNAANLQENTNLKCDFNKVALQLHWNRTLAWVFSCKFAACFQNISGGLLLAVYSKVVVWDTLKSVDFHFQALQYQLHLIAPLDGIKFQVAVFPLEQMD